MSIENKKSVLVPFLIIAGMFSIFGFVTWINSVLIPFMKVVCELTETQALLVATASYISFVVMGLPASFLIKKVGYRKGMSIGLALMAVGAIIFIPASGSRTYAMFLFGIFVQGAGMTILQTASNPYVTILGSIERAAQRISIMGICNKAAGALAAVILGSALLSGIQQVQDVLPTLNDSEKAVMLAESASSVITPYTIMAIVLASLAVLILFAPLPDLNLDKEDDESDADEKGSSKRTSIFQYPYLFLGVLALFCYVGVEVMAIDTIAAYGISLGMDGSVASAFPSYTIMCMIVGYCLGIILIPKFISQATALRISMILGVLLVFGVVFTPGEISIYLVAGLGLANALVWPAVWPLTLNKLGKFTKTASALLVMAIAGGALIPLIYGATLDNRKMAGVKKQSSPILNVTNQTLSFTKSYDSDVQKEAVDTINLKLDSVSIAINDKIDAEKIVNHVNSAKGRINKAYNKEIGFDSDFSNALYKKLFKGLDQTSVTYELVKSSKDVYAYSANLSDKSMLPNAIDSIIGILNEAKKESTEDNGTELVEDALKKFQIVKTGLSEKSELASTLEKSSIKLYEASELIRDSSKKASTFSYIIMLPLYLYILFFAIKGHKIGLEKD
ncbi:MAG: hypothetical protein CMD35_03745 [Flavobacteriales bacterium]|nr:hypothetical protein [Flavobacteriales bacterium]